MKMPPFYPTASCSKVLSVFLLLIFQSGNTASSQTAAENETAVERGRKLVKMSCSRCHAIGKNDSSNHPAAVKFRELSNRYPAGLLAEALAEGILTGHPDMPTFGFYPSEIEQITKYLETIQEKQ